MNHTERINEVSRQHCHLTRRLVKEAVEVYLELLADEIASGEWTELYGIAKIQVTVEAGSGTLFSKGKTAPQEVTHRLRTKIRLRQALKQKCYDT